jgi:hypothetical protein
MADISNVRYEEIKDITDSLEGLSCMYFRNITELIVRVLTALFSLACIMTRVLY